MGLRVGGLASGLDTSALVDSLLALERRPLDQALARKATFEFQQSLFRDLNTKLLALREAAAALDNRNFDFSAASIDEELLSFFATSSDESVLFASADANATAGTTTVTVNALATAGRQVSAGFVDETAIIANQGDTLQITVDGQTIDITIGAGGASLVDLRSLINQDANNAGLVRANILFDGTDHRLIVEGMATGVAKDVQVATTIGGPSGGSFFDAGLAVAATDASLDVFGVPVTRSSNAISDVIPGVQLQLRGTGTVQVQVDRDDGAIAEKMQAFVDAYNDVIDFTNQQSKYDVEAKQAGPLSGDSTVRGIGLTLQRSIVQQFSFTGNPFTSLGQIGVDVDREGRLTLDAEKLAQALDTDTNAVRELLGGDGTTDGLASALAQTLDPITDPANGTLAAREDGFDDQIAGLDRQIERIELRLAKREELLIAQFTRLESTIASLRNQGDSLLALVQPSNG